MSAIKILDLSGVWTFTPENGSSTSIEVPGGGWRKQGFNCDAAVYERIIDIPWEAEGNVVRLEIGAVNHYAAYYIAGMQGEFQKVYEEVTAFTNQFVDLTAFVKAGERYRLRIEVRSHQNGRAIAPDNFEEWPIPRGLFRSIHLCIYPAIYVQDVFIRTFTTTNTMSYTVTIHNETDQYKPIEIFATLSPWNTGASWHYPELPPEKLSLAPGSNQTFTLGPYDWKLPNESYWWPNIPYRHGFRSQLHVLTLRLSTGDIQATRFGFRQTRQEGNIYTLNGIRINTRGDSMQVANFDKVDNNGQGDAIDMLPGFLPPSATNPGWPQAVDNYQHLNISSQRAHRQPWSPYMLDVCDEMGMLIIAEGACGWDERDRRFHEMKCLNDQVRRDRNHPCIVRWSMKNEPICMNPEYMKELYDAIKESDDTRPICVGHTRWEWEKYDPERAYALIKDKGDFTWMDQSISYDDHGKVRYTAVYHNNAVIPMQERPYGQSGGLYPHCSTQRGLVIYATMAALVRAAGGRESRPFVLLSAWAGVIPGTKHTDFITEELRYPVYGEDNLPDPWGHPGIQLVQKAFDPLLCMDLEFWKMNEDSNGAGAFPVTLPLLEADKEVVREITVFNDDLNGSNLTLKWEIRPESSSNIIYTSGKEMLHVAPGHKTVVPLTFHTPDKDCTLFLALHVIKDGVERFTDLLTCYEVRGGKAYGYWGYADNTVTNPAWQERLL